MTTRSEIWKPRWKWFRPPMWVIFKWAYKISYKPNVDIVITDSTPIMQFDSVNKNGRMYQSCVMNNPGNVKMVQVAKGDGVTQVQIGVIKNYHSDADGGRGNTSRVTIFDEFNISDCFSKTNKDGNKEDK